MKKKLLLAFLVLAMCLSVIGCDKKPNTPVEDPNKETQKEEQKPEEKKEWDLSTTEGYLGRFNLTEKDMKPTNTDEWYVSGDYLIISAKAGTGNSEYEKYITQCINALKKISSTGVKNTIGEDATSKDNSLVFTFDGKSITLHIAHQDDLYQLSFD